MVFARQQVVVRISQQRLLYYDSLHGHGSNRLIRINDKSVPKQTNGCDCGNFICQFAERASREVCPS
uniref:Ubiquitin-like protease family profile domain-containing protein n=1 Tax=Ditylenchus dipsaci TaxID=166011 RepID=A0A915ED90_9BILA